MILISSICIPTSLLHQTLSIITIPSLSSHLNFFLHLLLTFFDALLSTTNTLKILMYNNKRDKEIVFFSLELIHFRFVLQFGQFHKIKNISVWLKILQKII